MPEISLGKWTYDDDAEHGYIIFREGGNNERSGLIGTSEWAWGLPEDLEALCELLNKHNFIAPSEK